MPILERTEVPYTDARAKGKFGVPMSGLNHQYANLYFTRLAYLGQEVKKTAKGRWGELAKNPSKTLDVEPGTEAVIVGTLYKDMKKKPNILNEMERDLFEEKKAPTEEEASDKYIGEGDTLMIEDESGRLVLKGDALRDRTLVSGVVVAVRGAVNQSGEFEVEDICLPGLPEQQPLPAGPQRGGDRFVALVSGLHLGHESQPMLPLEMMREYLTGLLGGGEEHAAQASTVRLVIAGNSTSGSAKFEEEKAKVRSPSPPPHSTPRPSDAPATQPSVPYPPVVQVLDPDVLKRLAQATRSRAHKEEPRLPSLGERAPPASVGRLNARGAATRGRRRGSSEARAWPAQLASGHRRAEGLPPFARCAPGGAASSGPYLPISP